MSTDSEVAAGIQLLNELVRATGSLELREFRPLGGSRFAYSVTFVSKDSASKWTNLVLSNEFLSDLPNTVDFRLAAQIYVQRTARRMANPHPMAFYCKVGIPVRIETEWPFQPVPQRAASFTHVSVHDLRTSQVAVVSLQMTYQQYIFDCNKNPFTIEAACVNTIRKALDARRLRFYPRDSHPTQLETVVLDTDLRGVAEPQSALEHFILGKVYLMGFKQGDRSTKVWIADDADADYLGTTSRALIQTAQILEAQKWIILEPTPQYASANDRLLSEANPFRSDASLAAKPNSPVVHRPSSEHDVFICHASADKASFVRPLAEALDGRGLKVWYDEFELKIGDSLRRKIDEGLAGSRYGVVVLSPAFFERSWPQWELDGLVAKEMNGQKVILPVWHNVTVEDVRKYSPSLSDKVAAKSSEGIDSVVDKLLSVILQGLNELKKEFDGGTHTAITRQEWQGLADQFHQLSTHTQADWFRDGDGVESWTIRNFDQDRQCEFLCELAGAMLLRSAKVSANLSDTTWTEPDNSYRWLYFLKNNKVPMKYLDGTTTQSGGKERMFLMGTIEGLSHQSYLMCIKCAAVEV